MDEDRLQRLRSEFPGSSWALWSERFPTDGCLEEDVAELEAFIHRNADQLDGSTVLVALNPSSELPRGYQNFHSPAAKHFDDRLKHFIQENTLTNLIGGYMTDIVPDEVSPDSRKITPENADTDRFLNQLDHLNHKAYDIICFSKQAFEALQTAFDADSAEYPESITSFSGSKDNLSVSVYRVWHYSNYGANADKVSELERQLQYLNDELLTDEAGGHNEQTRS